MTDTEKTPSRDNDGANEERIYTSHDTNPRPTARYVELSLIRALLNTRCGDVGPLCSGHDLRALHSDDRRLVLRELQAHAAEQTREGHPEQPVAPAAVMARIQAADGGTAAMQELTDALTGPIDGMQAGTPNTFAVPDLWKAVDTERLWRAMDSHAYALRQAAARRDAAAVPRLVNSHGPFLRRLAEVAGIAPDATATDEGEAR